MARPDCHLDLTRLGRTLGLAAISLAILARPSAATDENGDLATLTRPTAVNTRATADPKPLSHTDLGPPRDGGIMTHVGPVPPVIRVAVGEQMIAEPFVMRNAAEGWTGFNIELLRDCARAVGSRVELIEISPDRTFRDMLESGEVDIIPLVFEGDPLLTGIKPAPPLLHITPGIWVRDNSDAPTDLESLSGIRTTALNEGPSARWLLSKGIRPTKISQTRRAALRMLAAGEVDALFAGHAVMVGVIEELGLAGQLSFVNLSNAERIGSVTFGYNDRSENTAFWLGAGLDVVGASGRYAEHYRRFIATRSDLGDQAIANEAVYYSSVAGGGHLPGQTLRIGVADRGRALRFIFDKETNTGMAVDLGKTIGRALRRPVEVVNLTHEDVADAITRGVVHAAMLVPTTNAPSHGVDVLQPVLTLRGTLVMRGGNVPPATVEQLRQLRVAVTWNSGGHRYTTSIAHPSVLPVGGSLESIDMLVHDRVDAVVMLAAAKRSLEQQGLLPKNLVEYPIPENGYVSSEVITVRRGNSLLARDIEAVLSTLQSSGEFDRIYDRWLGSIEPRQAEINWAVIHAVGACMLLATTIGLAWIVTLRRTLANRTARVRAAEGQTAMLASALPVLMYSYVVRPDGTRSPLYFPTDASRWQKRFPSMLALDRPYEHVLRAAIHPEDADAYDLAATRARASLTTFDHEFRLRTDDGQYRWLHSIAVPRRVPDGVCWDSLVIDIDERRALMQAVSNSEARFRVLVQQAPHAAIQFYDSAGKVTAWNEASTRLYGWTAREAIGKSIGSLMLTEAQAAGFRSEIVRLSSGGLPGTPIELQFRTKSGGSGTLVSSVFALPTTDGGTPDEFVCMDIDITELRHAQERERLAREHLSLALDASNIGSWSVDIRDDTVIADARVIALFGMGDRAAPGEPASNTDFLINVVPEDIPAVTRAWNDAVDTVGTYACTFRVRVDGREAWVSGRGKAYAGPDGKAERIVGISIDITELKVAQLEREQLIVALERSKRLEALGLLAAGIAHDFNNILTAISGYATMIDQNIGDTQATREHLDAIESSTNQAALLIRQLISRPARDRDTLSGTDIHDVIRGCIAVATAGPDMRFHCEVRARAGAEHLQIHADRAQIQQIALNLIINAAEAARSARGGTPTSGAAVNVTLDRRTLTPESDRISTLSGPLPAGTYLVIDVADNGPGMDDSTMKKVFEPYFSTKVSGRGLGLSVVVSTIHSLGGAIKVSSAVGQGTTFRVLLPATTLHEPHGTREISRMTSQVEAKPTRNTHVLVVDDDALVQDVIVRALRSAGLRVTSFHAGQRAVDWLSDPSLHPTDRPDVALIDLSMPGIDGIETLRRLRRTLPELNAVMMSGYANDVVSHELAELGRAHFLQKPFKLKELQEVVIHSAATTTTS